MTTQHPSDHTQPKTPDDRAQVDALHFWLVSGIHQFDVDPRRRRGPHDRVRQLLTQDWPSPPASAGAWQSLASTLDRHTVLGGMTELSSRERRAVVLAYLEGYTNREIAIGLGTSVATVRRLLRRGLERLDTYITRTGTWIYCILLLGAAHLAYAATRFGRAIRFDGSIEWTQVLGSTAAVGAITAAAIGSGAISPGSIGPETISPPLTAQSIAAPPPLGDQVSPSQRPKVAPAPKAPLVAAGRSHGRGQTDNETQSQTTGADHSNNGNAGQGLALGHLKQKPDQPRDQDNPPDQQES